MPFNSVRSGRITEPAMPPPTRSVLAQADAARYLEMEPFGPAEKRCKGGLGASAKGAAICSAIFLAALQLAGVAQGQVTYQSNLVFDFNQDPNTGDYSFVSLNGGVTFATPPISVSSVALVGGNNWSNVGGWTSGVALSDALLATEDVVNIATGIASRNPVNVFTSAFGLGTLMVDQGPTERAASFSVPLASGDAEIDQAIASSHLSASAPIQYDVTITSGTDMTMDQPNVIVQSLTVQSGSSLAGNGNFTVRTDLINQGSVIGLGGTIQGNFDNTTVGPQAAYAAVSGALDIQGAITNSGILNVASGGALSLSQAVPNTGTIEATGGGTLSLGGSVSNLGGIVEADGGTVLLNGGTITDGALVGTSATGTGSGSEINVQGNSTLSAVAVTLASGSNLLVFNNSTLALAGGSTITNNGTITVNNSDNAANTGVTIDGAVDLAGSGSIVLNAMPGHINTGQITDSASGAGNLTQESGHTILGTGQITVNTFTNNGTVNADSNGNMLRLAGTGIYTNTGLMEATGGGTLDISTLTNYSNGILTGGTYDVVSGGTIVLPGAVTTNAATITISGATANFSGLSALTANTGTLNLLNGASLSMAGGLTNSGKINLDPSTLDVNGNFTQASDGVLMVTLDGNGAGQYGLLNVTGTANLAGALDLSFINGYIPRVGDSFTVLNYGSYSGMFSAIQALGNPNYQLATQYTNSGLVLTTTAVPEPAPLLILLAASSLALVRRRRRKAATKRS